MTLLLFVALYYLYQYIQKTVTFYWPPAFLMAFLPFQRLIGSKKSNHSITRMVAFRLFYCKLYLFNPVSSLFRRPRITDIRLRKSFYLQPVGNITVCNRKSPLFGIYSVARLYAIFVCFSMRRFAGFFSEFFANNR